MGTYDCLTNREIERLQALRDSGLSIRQISKKTGRSRETVSRRTTGIPTPVVDHTERNNRLLRLVEDLRRNAREAQEELAMQHGFTDAHSMSVQLSKHRRRLRSASREFLEAAE